MADPDLTTRARAVLAGLDEEDVMDARDAVALLDDRSESCLTRGFEIAEEHGMIKFAARWHTTDLGREVARLLREEDSAARSITLHALAEARAVLAKCPWCIHPRHAGLCTGRNGGTAYQCPCFQDSLHAPEAIEAARIPCTSPRPRRANPGAHHERRAT